MLRIFPVIGVCFPLYYAARQTGGAKKWQGGFLSENSLPGTNGMGGDFPFVSALLTPGPCRGSS